MKKILIFLFLVCFLFIPILSFAVAPATEQNETIEFTETLMSPILTDSNGGIEITANRIQGMTDLYLTNLEPTIGNNAFTAKEIYIYPLNADNTRSLYQTMSSGYPDFYINTNSAEQVMNCHERISKNIRRDGGNSLKLPLNSNDSLSDNIH
jgi:hypothetical protein